MCCKSSGFSLIELLVVVAIIGILGVVGVVGYNSYIDRTQDRATEANLETVARAIQQDNLALSENIDSASDLSGGLDKNSQCIVQVERIVEQLNVNESGRNTFDDNCWKAFNGNRLWSHDFVTASGAHGIGTLSSGSGCGFVAPVASDTTLTVPRGAIMVACSDARAAINTSSYKIYTCACVGQPDCLTTDVVAHCSGSGDANCARDFLKNNPDKCPSPGADYVIY